MNVIIVGIGRIGAHLCEILSMSGHDVTVIEKDEKKCEELLSKTDVNVIKGNATDPEILEEAGIGKCDIFIASSDRDEVNFITAMHAKSHGVARVIARINEAEYEKMVRNLGIETIAPDLSSAREIDLRIIKPTVAKLVLPGVGDIEILEVEIAANSPHIGKNLSTIKIKDCKPIVVHKKDEFELNTEEHMIEAGDIIILLCRPHAIKDALKLFKAPKSMLKIFGKK